MRDVVKSLRDAARAVRDGSAYYVEITPDEADAAADEIERLRTIAGRADVGPSFAEIAKDLPRRSGESD